VETISRLSPIILVRTPGRWVIVREGNLFCRFDKLFYIVPSFKVGAG
jgi:hypothetical protein